MIVYYFLFDQHCLLAKSVLPILNSFMKLYKWGKKIKTVLYEVLHIGTTTYQVYAMKAR